MVFKLLLALGLFLAVNTLKGQKTDETNGIFYTYSGSKFIGKIDKETDQSIFLDLNDGNTVEVNIHNIRSYLSPSEVIIYKKGKYHLTRGLLVNWTLAGGLTGEENTASSHNNLALGYHLNKFWTLGGGIGVDFNEGVFNGLNIDTQVIPVFVYGRYYLTQSRNRLFLYGKCGFASGIDDNLEGDSNGGFIAHTGIGLHFSSIGKTKFLLKLGTHVQHASGTQIDLDPFGNEIESKYDVVFRRLMIGFSLDFTTRRKDYQK